MPWPAIIAAGGAIIGGLISSKGASDAADAQGDAADQAAAVHKYTYDQTRADQAPWMQAGQWALGAPEGGYAPDINALQQQRQRLVNQLNSLQNPSAPQQSTIQNERGTETVWGPGRAHRGLPPVEYSNGPNADILRKAYEGWADKRGIATDDTSFPVGNAGLNPQAIGDVQNQLAQLDQQIADAQAGGGNGKPGTGLVGMIERGPGEFTESPGYQFTLDEGNRAIQNSLSAMGKNRSGSHLRSATQYAEGMASTEYDNFLNRWYKSLSPYQSLAGMGQTSAAELGGQGASAAANMGNAYMAGGDASAAGSINQANALTGAMQGGMNQLLYANSLRNLQQPQFNGSFTSGNPNVTGRPVDQWQYSG